MADPIQIPPQASEAEQKNEPQAAAPQIPPVAPATGRRAAFKSLNLELTDEELKNSGTQKCILDMLNRAEEECNDLREFRTKYFDANAKVGVFEAKEKSNKTNEIMFGFGLGVGCAIIGVAPYFFDKAGVACGLLALVVGFALTIGFTFGRSKYK